MIHNPDEFSFIPGIGPGSASVSAPTETQLPATWRSWVAENLLLGNSPQSVLEAMVKAAIDPKLAEAEIRSAMDHPYLAGARKAGGMIVDDESDENDPRILKRDWVLECYRGSAMQASDFGAVPRANKPSRTEFLDQYYAANKPVVIEGAMNDWPALKKWTSPLLKQRVGNRLVEVQANRNSDPNFELNKDRLKKVMPFDEFVDTIEQAGQTNNWYMTAANSGRNVEALKELWDDIVLFPEYLRGNDPANRGFFWFGPAGTITPLHHDLTNNFMAQVRGRKLVRLIAPYEFSRVYNTRHCFSEIDLDNIDLQKYPKFKDVRVIDVVIGPGDLLFLPIGWWHYVRGLDISITMTFTNFVFDNSFFESYKTYEAI